MDRHERAKAHLLKSCYNDKKVAYVSTDGLTAMLKSVGVPSFYDKNKAEPLFSYLEAFIERMMPIGPNYTIEGDAFTPHHAHTLSKIYDVRAVFLGMSEVSVDKILDYAKHDKWIKQADRDHLKMFDGKNYPGKYRT